MIKPQPFKIQTGDLIRYWIEPTTLKHRRILHGKIGIVIAENGYGLIHVDFIDFGEEWIDETDAMLLSRPS